MLRKCTLKILPRSPNQRITSKISRAGSSSISAIGALAEIEAVIGALMHRHEPLQPVDRAEHAGHAAIAGRRVGVLRMAGEAHLRRGRDRHDRRQKMVDPLPIFVFGDDAGNGRRRRLVGAAPAEGGVARAAAARLPLGARDADDRQIVFGRRNAGRREPFDQAADAVEFALPLRLLSPTGYADSPAFRSAPTTSAIAPCRATGRTIRHGRGGGADRRGSNDADCRAGRRRHG